MIDQEIELVAGPFDGVVLHPHSGCLHTVLEHLDAEQFPWSGPSMPNHVEFLEDTVLLVGNDQLGDALYRSESGRRWQYVPMEMVGS